MSGGTLNLSLLSRGVGEVKKNCHEKVDVYFEPEDYLNFSTGADRFYLPPVDPKYPASISDNLTTRSSREVKEFRVPKTYSTRKGALLLFSEDLAQRYTVADLGGAGTLSHQHGAHVLTKSLHSQIYLKTVEDLAKSVLKYGGQGHLNDNIYLKFVHAHCGTFERQFRPGFSAKRYLSTWTRTWDDAVFDNVIKHGYITEQSLYQYNLALPGLRRRLIYDDLSHMPEPYKLMRNMLMTPGSLSGYTFYSALSQDFEEREDKKTGSVVVEPKFDKFQNIHVIKTKGRVQKEVVYYDLDRQSQKEVITDLLVKSAVHYALKKQEEVYKDSIIRALRSEQNSSSEEDSEEQSVKMTIQEFDMKEAVESLLDSQHGRFSIGADLSEIDDRSHGSDGSGSFKASHRGSSSGDESEIDREFMGRVRVFAGKDSSEFTKNFSSVPVLPPIHTTLSPIKDSSRETSEQNFSLPPLGEGALPQVNIQPATPQTGNTTSTSGPGTSDAKATRSLTSPDIDALSELEENDTESEGDRISKTRRDITSSITQSSNKDNDGEAAAGNVSSHRSTSITTGNAATDTRKAHKKWKSYDWQKGSDNHAGPMKGSRIMAPDGEIISVGGSVLRSNGRGFDASSLKDASGHQESKDMSSDKSSGSDNDLGDRKRAKISNKSEGSKKSHKKESGSLRSNITGNEIMDMLTNHARHVAENVLSHPLAGTDLETDVKLAAKLWSKMYPSKPLSRFSNYGGDSAEVIDEIMHSRPTSSEVSSADEYKSLIRKSLTTAVTKAAGLDPDLISSDAEISPELLEALVNHRMAPDQIEIVTGSDGHTRIQSKVELSGVMETAHDRYLHAASGKDDDGISRHQISIPGDNVLLNEDVGVDQVQETDDVSQERKKPKPASDRASPALEEETPSAADQTVVPPRVKRGKKIPPSLPGRVPREKKTADTRITKHGKTGISQKGEPSKDSKKKGKSEEDKEEPFVVGMPKEKKTNNEPSQPHKEAPHKEAKKVKTKKKVKKGKKKAEKQPPQQQFVEPPAEKPEEAPEIEKQLSSQPPTPDIYESRLSSPEMKTDESDSEFSFVRVQSSPEPEEYEEQEENGGDMVSETKQRASLDKEDKSDAESGEDEEASKLKSISNREARAAKRAAAAAKRREEVERRRKLKEEQVKRDKEEMERQIVLQKEMEEQRKKGEEERRLRKQQQMDEEEREKLEAEEAERRQKLEAERERRLKEEYMRRLEEMKRKQHEEELRKQELMLQIQKEEEEKKAAEELMLSKMALQERLEYERMKREKEEERKKKELEDKLRRAEEAKAAMEEAQRLAEEMARKQAEIETRLKFNRSLQEEASRLTQAHTINRAFVFSYFELLQWLGLDIPEFELAKLAEL